MATSITGNTFPVKDKLKALGGRWNPDTKAWMVPDDKAAEARAIVAGAGAKTPAPSGNYPRRRTRGGCRCARPLDEGDGECMYCGYMIPG